MLSLKLALAYIKGFIKEQSTYAKFCPYFWRRLVSMVFGLVLAFVTYPVILVIGTVAGVLAEMGGHLLAFMQAVRKLPVDLWTCLIGKYKATPEDWAIYLTRNGQ